MEINWETRQSHVVVKVCAGCKDVGFDDRKGFGLRHNNIEERLSYTW